MKKQTQGHHKKTNQHYKGKTHMCRSLVHIIIQSGIPTTLVGDRLRTYYLHIQHTRSVMGPTPGPNLLQEHIRLLTLLISTIDSKLQHFLNVFWVWREVVGFVQQGYVEACSHSLSCAKRPLRYEFEQALGQHERAIHRNLNQSAGLVQIVRE
jgi:hypothetical protein